MFCCYLSAYSSPRWPQALAFLQDYATGIQNTNVPKREGPATFPCAHSTPGLKASVTKGRPSAASELGDVGERHRSHVNYL